jgi:hypothetical protein
MNVHQWQAQMERAIAIEAGITLVVLLALTAVWFWVLYLVVKAAMRDAIRESGLLSHRPAPTPRSTIPAELDNLRAER